MSESHRADYKQPVTREATTSLMHHRKAANISTQACMREHHYLDKVNHQNSVLSYTVNCMTYVIARCWCTPYLDVQAAIKTSIWDCAALQIRARMPMFSCISRRYQPPSSIATKSMGQGLQGSSGTHGHPAKKLATSLVDMLSVCRWAPAHLVSSYVRDFQRQCLPSVQQQQSV